VKLARALPLQLRGNLDQVEDSLAAFYATGK
jgi:hypothetical protein